MDTCQMFQPSKYQQAIFDWIKNGEGNAVVEAVAGSGKTTTAIKCMELIPRGEPVLFLAFNKAIADELKTKVPQHAHVMTLNGLGHRTWCRMYGKVALDASKTKTLMRKHLSKELLTDYGQAVSKLVGLCKAYGVVPEMSLEEVCDEVVGLLPDTRETYVQLIEHFDIEFDRAAVNSVDIVIDLTKKVLRESIKLQGLIDFDDQIYFSVIFGGTRPTYKWIFVDESQDLSPAQRALVMQTIAPGGRIVAIGDSRQAIYGFRGADCDSMKNFQEQLGAVRLDLSICYRCPSSHIAFAKDIVPEIEAAPNAEVGEIADIGLAWRAEDFQKTDIIICRNSAPLVRAAYQILAKKIPVKIKGKDIGKGLIRLIESMHSKNWGELSRDLARWYNREVDRLMADDHNADISKVQDKYDAVTAFMDMLPEGTPEQICKEIENLFTDFGGNCLTLSTVHRAKGLEADRVYILNASLMPSWSARKPWEKEQEENLQYVAYTRAKKTLGFIEINMPKKKF